MFICVHLWFAFAWRRLEVNWSQLKTILWLRWRLTRNQWTAQPRPRGRPRRRRRSRGLGAGRRLLRRGAARRHRPPCPLPAGWRVGRLAGRDPGIPVHLVDRPDPGTPALREHRPSALDASAGRPGPNVYHQLPGVASGLRYPSGRAGHDGSCRRPGHFTRPRNAAVGASRPGHGFNDHCLDLLPAGLACRADEQPAPPP